MNVRLAIFALGAISLLAAPLAEAQSSQMQADRVSVDRHVIVHGGPVSTRSGRVFANSATVEARI